MTTPDPLREAAQALLDELDAEMDVEQHPLAEHYRRQAIERLRAALATPSEPTLDATPHEHYWVDAFDDETAWHCAICGVTEYPEDRPASERLLDDHQPKVDYGYETVACSCGWEPHQGGASIEDPDEWWWDDHIRPLFLDTRLGGSPNAE